MARKIWINTSNSFILHTGEFENPPQHFNVSIAAGHVLPMDDFILSKDTPLPLETYELADPDLNRTALSKPVLSQEELVRTESGMTIESGDVAAKKISFNSESTRGTYQVGAATENIVAGITGADGEMIKSKIKYFAKSYLTVGEWTEPKPLGHEFELMPLNDLSNVRVGDPVSFQADFMGNDFTCNGEGMEYLLAKSNTFGGEAGGDMEGFFLSAYLVNGRARFRLPSPGQWMIAAFNFRDVPAGSDLEKMADGCSKIYYHATLTFNVRA